MLKEKLLQYKKENNISWEDLAKKLKLSRPGLSNIIKFGSPKTKVITCLKIKSLIGLEPWEYLNGLDSFKNLTKKDETKKY
jgi:DNA-binding XRE family transcriptional regulator